MRDSEYLYFIHQKGDKTTFDYHKIADYASNHSNTHATLCMYIEMGVFIRNGC